jgi:hypothetical protein
MAVAIVLYVREVAADAPREHVEAWVPRVPGIAEVLHARFVEHRYPPHTHDTWTLIIIDGGEIRYDLVHHHRGADRGTVTILPPHVTHDGRAATDVGFRKRVVYLDTTLVPATLIGRSVDRSEITDPNCGTPSPDYTIPCAPERSSSTQRPGLQRSWYGFAPTSATCRTQGRRTPGWPIGSETSSAPTPTVPSPSPRPARSFSAPWAI